MPNSDKGSERCVSATPAQLASLYRIFSSLVQHKRVGRRLVEIEPLNETGSTLQPLHVIDVSDHDLSELGLPGNRPLDG